MMTMKERDLLISVIYERCSCGEISIEERENLIDDVKEKYIRENTIIEDVEIDEDVLDKINMFKEAVYEKYSNGEITLEEREELIDRVHKEFIDVYTESSDVGIFKKKIDEIKRKNSHKRDNFKKKKLNKFNNKMIAETKQIIEKNERNLKGLIFCYPHYEHIMRKDTADAIRNLHNIIEEINPERSVEENKVVVDKYKDTSKGITADFKKYDTGIKGYMIKVNVDEFYKNLTEFAKHMTDDINLLESMDKTVYDTVMARSKKIKDKYIYNALNSMYSDYCQFSTFILSLYTAEITSYYKGISILNKYNKQHREHELTPEAQRIKNIDNNSILNAMMKKGAKNKGGYSLDFNDETSATKDYTSREYNLYKYDGDDDYKESVYDKYYSGEISLDEFITEKATSEQYRMKAFKKKYNYNPKDKSIIVDGEKYYVDLDVNNPIMKIKDANGNFTTVARFTSANIMDDNGTINLDKNFFKLKNSGRRDAILKHEIGHVKSNAIKNNGKAESASIQTNYDAYVKETFNTAKSFFKQLDIHMTDKEIMSIIKQQLKDAGITQSTYEPTSAERKKQKVIREIRAYIEKKYTANRDAYNDHTNYKEIEADRYAANHSSDSNLKKGLREYNKYNKSEKSIKRQLKASGAPSTKEVVDASRKKITRGGNDDYELRAKALKDKKIKDNSAYKK